MLSSNNLHLASVARCPEPSVSLVTTEQPSSNTKSFLEIRNLFFQGDISGAVSSFLLSRHLIQPGGGSSFSHQWCSVENQESFLQPLVFQSSKLFDLSSQQDISGAVSQLFYECSHRLNQLGDCGELLNQNQASFIPHPILHHRKILLLLPSSVARCPDLCLFISHHRRGNFAFWHQWRVFRRRGILHQRRASLGN